MKNFLPYHALGLLLAISFLLATCHKSSEETGQNSGFEPSMNPSIPDGATDREEGPICVTCDFEWRVVCPRSCVDEGFYDYIRVQVGYLDWDRAQDCCVPSYSLWEKDNGLPMPTQNWREMNGFQLKSSVTAPCGSAFSPYLLTEAWLDQSGLKAPGEVYVQFRRKGDTTNASRTTHKVPFNPDLEVCNTSNSSNPIYTFPIRIEDDCRITSQYMVSLPYEIYPCQIPGTGHEGGGH